MPEFGGSLTSLMTISPGATIRPCNTLLLYILQFMAVGLGFICDTTGLDRLFILPYGLVLRGSGVFFFFAIGVLV